MINYTAEHQRQAVELRQYQQILRAVQAAARTYSKRSGAYINPDEHTPADLAAAAYIIMAETGTRPGETTADTIRRAAYEAVRRAARDQQRHAHADQRHAHADQRDDHTPEDGAPDEAIEAAPLLEIIQQAGAVALLMVDGMDTRGIALTLGVSTSTAWRLMGKARQAIRKALDT